MHATRFSSNDKFKSNFSLFKAEEVMFLPLGIITKNTLKNIIQPKIMPTDKKANLGPKIFVKQNEITAPIMNKYYWKNYFIIYQFRFTDKIIN